MSLALMRLVKCIWILQVRPHTDYLLSGSAGQESVVVATKLPWHRLGSGPAIGRVAKRSFARISIPMTADLFITDAQGPNCQRQVRPRTSRRPFDPSPERSGPCRRRLLPIVSFGIVVSNPGSLGRRWMYPARPLRSCDQILTRKQKANPAGLA